MLSLTDKRQLVAVIFIILTLSFIFIQSALPPVISSSESSAVSDWVADIVAGIIGDDSPEAIARAEAAAAFINKNMRKIAHMVEFAALGSEVALLGCFMLLSEGEARIKRRALLAISLMSGLLVAFCDESIQILSKRGPSVTDVWIDLAGYSLLLIPLHFIAFAVLKKRKKTEE